MIGARVRYLPNGDNRLLRHFLGHEWNFECHWCREVKEYASLEIDHIVPQASSVKQRRAYQRAFNLPDAYDIDALENLAPICGPCNKSKSAKDLTGYGLVITSLVKARSRANAVNRKVLRFRQQSKLGEAVLVILEADLTDLGSRSTLEEGAPAMVQRLSEVGLADFRSSRTVEIEIGDDQHTVTIRLDEKGRSTVDVLERVAGVVLHNVVQSAVSDLFRQASQAAAIVFEAAAGEWAAPDVDVPVLEWPRVVIDSAAYVSAAGAELEFEIAGELEAFASGWLTRSAADGDGLEHVQVEGNLTCRFTFSLAWGPDQRSGELFFDQVWLDNVVVDAGLQAEPRASWLDL